MLHVDEKKKTDLPWDSTMFIIYVQQSKIGCLNEFMSMKKGGKSKQRINNKEINNNKEASREGRKKSEETIVSNSR